jgi:hypothetical protein
MVSTVLFTKHLSVLPWITQSLQTMSLILFIDILIFGELGDLEVKALASKRIGALLDSHRRNLKKTKQFEYFGIPLQL